MKAIAPLLAALMLTACVPEAPAQQPRPATATPAPMVTPARAGAKPIVIRNDRGGNVLQAIRRRAELERSGRPVEVRGYCRSACTIYITLPNACLGRGARVGFHAPRIEGTTIIPPYVDQMMGSFYRNGIRQRWFGGWNRARDMQIITAREYVRLDPQTRLCN